MLFSGWIYMGYLIVPVHWSAFDSLAVLLSHLWRKIVIPVYHILFYKVSGYLHVFKDMPINIINQVESNNKNSSQELKLY